MIGTSGDGVVRAVDDLERPVVLAPLTGDDKKIGRVLHQRPDGLVHALRHRDEREARVVRQRPLDVEGVEAFDGDQCADRMVHRLSLPSAR